MIRRCNKGFVFLQVLTVIFWCSIPASEAQTSNTLYYLKGVPQRIYFNPALQPQCNVYIGFPAISSVYLNFDNNSLDFEDVIFHGTGEYRDSLITFLHPSYNPDLFLDKLRDRLYLSPEVGLSLLSFGFRTKEWYFTFDATDLNTLKLTFPKDLFTLILKGNGAFLGTTADFSDLGIDISYYRQYSLGISKNITDRLTIGGKAKVLFGKANLSFDDTDIGLYTDPETYNLLFHSKFTLRGSGPVAFTDTVGNPIDILYTSWLKSLISGEIELTDLEGTDLSTILLQGKNLGFGLDLGIDYRLNDRLGFSASVIDLAFIKWKEDVYSFSQDGAFEFTGVDISEGIRSDSFDVTMDREFENLGDSITEIFELTSSNDPYTTWLPAKIYAGATFNITPTLTLGLLSRSEIYKGHLRQSVTLSANTLLANFLSFSLSYSIMNYTYDNLGIGLGIRGGPLQFYLVTDRIPLRYSMIQYTDQGEETRIPVFLDQRTLNFRFGLNLAIGCKEKGKKDRPLVE